jgi:hypothetical protein
MIAESESRNVVFHAASLQNKDFLHDSKHVDEIHRCNNHHHIHIVKYAIRSTRKLYSSFSLIHGCFTIKLCTMLLVHKIFPFSYTTHSQSQLNLIHRSSLNHHQSALKDRSGPFLLRADSSFISYHLTDFLLYPWVD